jgi:DNA repair protein RadC
MGVAIAALPGHDRPRERRLSCGVDALSERELLALVLRSGRPGESALDLAAALLADFGGLDGLSGARPEELAGRPGVGPAKAAALVAALRLGRLGSSEVVPRRLGSAADIAAAVWGLLDGQRRERVVVLVCDAANQLLRTVLVSEGAVDRSMLPVREILNAVLRHDGRAFAVAHNHPSGDPEPSDADVRATDEVTAAARTVGLRFLDHVIVAGGEWCRAVAIANRRTPD